MFIQYVCMSSSFLVACPALQAPSHSTLSGTAIYPGVVILVQCDTGYTLKGIANVTCLVNGSWNHALPSCQQGKTTCYYLTLHCQWLCAWMGCTKLYMFSVLQGKPDNLTRITSFF